MDPDQLAENRRQLAQLARQKKMRVVPDGLPCSWLPQTVIDPDTKQPFTAAAAWEFIAQMLENVQGQEVAAITLTERPAGTTAYVMVCPLDDGILYVKVHRGPHGRNILARSFHYSEHGNYP